MSIELRPGTLAALEDVSNGTFKWEAISGDGTATGTRIRCACLECGSAWEATVYMIVRRDSRRSGCPACGEKLRVLKKIEGARAKIDALCAELGYERLSEYTHTHEKILVGCGECGGKFSITPNHLRGGQRCPTCSGSYQHLGEEGKIRAYCEGTRLSPASRPEGGRVVLRCQACGRAYDLSISTLRQTMGEPLASRDCQCQLRQARLEDYMRQNAPGYSLAGPCRFADRRYRMRVRHDRCGHVWEVTDNLFMKEMNPTRCPKCAHTSMTSRGQIALASFLGDELGLDIEENVRLRRLLPGAHFSSTVDILVGGSVVVEFDGVWWHGECKKRSRTMSHRKITEEGAVLRRSLELAERGIRVVRIFSDEWDLHGPAARSRLRAIFGRPTEVLNARSLMVDPNVPRDEARAFLTASHLQGPVASQARLGLRDGDGALASLMTFGERSLGRTSQRRLELLRFCSRPGASVRGGAGRLLAAFRREYATDAAEITSYADARWTSLVPGAATVYDRLGFRKVRHAKPGYSYVDPSRSDRRVSRLSCQRHMLAERLASAGGDPAGMTEARLADELGLARVWDCGQLVFSLPLS